MPLKAIMSWFGLEAPKTINQIYTHITKSMEHATIYSLATVALNQK